MTWREIFRLPAGIIGLFVPLATYLGHDGTAGGKTAFIASAAGVALGMAMAWMATYPRRPRWRATIAASVVGSMFAMLVAALPLVGVTGSEHFLNLGWIVGFGLGNGLILGAAAALLLFGFVPLAPPDAHSPTPAQTDRVRVNERNP